MNTNDYEIAIARFDKYREAVDRIFVKCSEDEIKDMFVTLLHFVGLSGEVGELGEKIKKSIRDKNKIDLRDEAILKELGDKEWYGTRLASDFGYTQHEVCQMNLDKLTDRNNRNVIHGEGDER